jgi:hypothetical protein
VIDSLMHGPCLGSHLPFLDFASSSSVPSSYRLLQKSFLPELPSILIGESLEVFDIPDYSCLSCLSAKQASRQPPLTPSRGCLRGYKTDRSPNTFARITWLAVLRRRCHILAGPCDWFWEAQPLIMGDVRLE